VWLEVRAGFLLGTGNPFGHENLLGLERGVWRGHYTFSHLFQNSWPYIPKALDLPVVKLAF
jgi:hypothetical protein